VGIASAKCAGLLAALRVGFALLVDFYQLRVIHAITVFITDGVIVCVQAILRWPTPLSAESVEDLKAWIEILQKKIARSVKPDDTLPE
jgi:hypothetical protein